MLKKNSTAWNTSKIFLEYINNVIKPFVLAQRLKPELKGKTAVLIVDNFSGHHLEESVVQGLKKFGLIIKFLRPYTTSLCQPLDLSINYLIKSHMKQDWITWFNKSPGSNPNKQIVYSWFKKAYDSITPLNIIKAFLISGISNDPQGNEDILSPNLLSLRARNQERTKTHKDTGEAPFYENIYDSPEHQYFQFSKEDEGEYVFNDVDKFEYNKF